MVNGETLSLRGVKRRGNLLRVSLRGAERRGNPIQWRYTLGLPRSLRSLAMTGEARFAMTHEASCPPLPLSSCPPIVPFIIKLIRLTAYGLRLTAYVLRITAY